MPRRLLQRRLQPSAVGQRLGPRDQRDRMIRGRAKRALVRPDARFASTNAPNCATVTSYRADVERRHIDGALRRAPGQRSLSKASGSLRGIAAHQERARRNLDEAEQLVVRAGTTRPAGSLRPRSPDGGGVPTRGALNSRLRTSLDEHGHDDGHEGGEHGRADPDRASRRFRWGRRHLSSTPASCRTRASSRARRPARRDPAPASRSGCGRPRAAAASGRTTRGGAWLTSRASRRFTHAAWNRSSHARREQAERDRRDRRARSGPSA